MENQKIFDSKKIGDLAEQIERQIEACAHLKMKSEQASSEYNSATTRLHNLQSEFTKQVNCQLDHSAVRNPNPAREVR